MIDIATIERENNILVSVDSAAKIMDIDQAKDLVTRWARVVEEALELS